MQLVQHKHKLSEAAMRTLRVMLSVEVISQRPTSRILDRVLDLLKNQDYPDENERRLKSELEGIPRSIREQRSREIAAAIKTIKFTYWQDGDYYLGFLNDYPDYVTEGMSKKELISNLTNLLDDVRSGEVPYVRKVEELVVAE